MGKELLWGFYPVVFKIPHLLGFLIFWWFFFVLLTYSVSTRNAHFNSSWPNEIAFFIQSNCHYPNRNILKFTQSKRVLFHINLNFFYKSARILRKIDTEDQKSDKEANKNKKYPALTPYRNEEQIREFKIVLFIKNQSEGAPSLF